MLRMYVLEPQECYIIAFLLQIAAVIGFLRDYTVTEGVDFMVDVEIAVLSGELGRPVAVDVITLSDGSAEGKQGFVKTVVV